MRFDQKLLEKAVEVEVDRISAYLIAIVMAATAIFLRLSLDGYLGGAQFATYYPAVLLAALLCGAAPALLTTVLCGLASWYLLMPPEGSLTIAHPTSRFALLLYFLFAPLAAIAVSDLRRAVRRRRDAEARQLILIHELQHRTRNLLAVVRGVAMQTIATSNSLDAFARQFNSRLSALGRVQGLLSLGEAIDFEELACRELRAHYGMPDGQRVSLTGPSVMLGARAAQGLALALHELATNAMKYGAFKDDEGRLELCWRVDGSAGHRTFVLDWIERGVSLPPGAGDGASGFGRQLIEKALPYDLRARTRLEFTSDGVHFHVEMPVAGSSHAGE